ncbi:MAG: hypothetical protein IJU41_03555 [Clostridia bacterium]|nr:hypothetical protein [Clostridia bacterium]
MSKPTSEVIKRYKQKAIRRIGIDMQKSLADAWEEQLAKDGLTKSGFVKEAIRAYLAENGVKGTE